MDRKQYKIINNIFCFLIISLFSIIFTSCFLIERNSKEYKRPLLKSINVDANNVVKIVLDNTNEYKKFGQIHEVRLIYLIPVFEYEENENEIILKEDISEYKERFQEDGKYRIEINWFGGHLFIDTEYKNGQFSVLEEHFGDRY